MSNKTKIEKLQAENLALSESVRVMREALERLLNPKFEWVNIGKPSGRIAPEPVYEFKISTDKSDVKFAHEALQALDKHRGIN